MLSSQERLFFDTFGFLVRRGVFAPGEVRAISEDFEAVMAEDRQGREFPGAKRHGVMSFIELRPGLTRLAEDDRIYNALEDLLGPGITYIGSDGNLYVGDTHWHSDGSEPYLRIKVAIYLDSVEKETGCLRVVPGSHRSPLHQRLTELAPADEATDSPYGVDGSDVPCFALESEPGDVVFFNTNLFHSSFGGRTGRRMFTIVVGARPTADGDFDYLRRAHERNRSHFIPELQVTQTDRVYTDAFLHHDSPRIQGLVAPLLELGLT